MLSGTYAFGAVMTALLQRQETGHGQMIDVSMLESMLSLLLGEVQTAQFPVPPAGRPMFGPVRTADGYIMPAVASERSFQGLARAAGHPEWITDARFVAYPDRRRHWGELIDELEVWSAACPPPRARPLSTARACPARRTARCGRCLPIRNWLTARPWRKSGMPAAASAR